MRQGYCRESERDLDPPSEVGVRRYTSAAEMGMRSIFEVEATRCVCAEEVNEHDVAGIPSLVHGLERWSVYYLVA
jgi:hypothetical protein